MAAGDTVSYGAYNVANNGNTDIQPSAGVEVVIQELEAEQGKAMTVKRTADGSNFTTIEVISGGLMQVNLRCTNTYWIRLTNTSGGAAGNYACGVQTK